MTSSTRPMVRSRLPGTRVDLARWAWLVLAGASMLAAGSFGPAAPAASAEEAFHAFPVANLNRTFDSSALPPVLSPVALDHGLVFTWSRELWRTDGTPVGTRRLCGPDPDLCVHVRQVLESPSGLLFFLDDRLREDDRALWRTDGTEGGTYPVSSPGRTRLQELIFFDSHVHEPSGRLFFAAEDLEARTGLELWVTDGTVAGTREVRDIAAGPFEFDSWPIFGATLGPWVVFSATDGDTDREPWITDGTADGTFELFDVNRARGSYPFDFRTLGDQVLFFTGLATSLWRTDGLRDGTTERVTRFSSDLGFLARVGPVVGDRVLFFLGHRLWASDGTAEGTVPVTDLARNQLLFEEIVVAGARAIFRGASLDEGEQVWAADGTPEGTHLLIDPCPGSCNSRPGDFQPAGSRVAFSMDDGLTGRELWITDGTPGGTRRLVDFCPGPCSSGPKVVGHLGGFLWVRADGGEGRELWRVRVATGEAHPLTDLGLTDPFPDDGEGGLHGGALLFSAVDPVRGQALWRSDGTPAGTRPYFTLAEPADQSSLPDNFTRWGRELFFGAQTPEAGLWATDGTGDGTRLVWAAPEGVERIGRIVRLEGSPGLLVFATVGRNRDRVDLYRSDGTAEGTVRLAEDIDRDGFPGLIHDGDRVFYLAEGNPRPWEEAGIWVSDGTIEGTRRILRLPVLGFPAVRLLGRRLIFVVDDANTSFQETTLWVSDGTPEGTHPLLDARQQPVRQPSDLTILGSALVFTAADPGDPERTSLWVSDGTSRGTSPLEVSDSEVPSSPRELTVVGSTLFFTARVAEGGPRELWQSDGTPAGTRRLETSVGPVTASRLQALGDRLLFFGRAAAPGDGEADPEALWITDGTATGTRRLAQVRREVRAATIGDSLFFIEDEPPVFFPINPPPPDLPPRLWRSDGTTEGTSPLTLPLPEALPKGLRTVAGHLLLFTLNDERGTDLWALDNNGDAVARIGRFASVGSGFFRLGQRMLFAATRRETGEELWAFDLPTAPPEPRRPGSNPRSRCDWALIVTLHPRGFDPEGSQDRRCRAPSNGARR